MGSNEVDREAYQLMFASFYHGIFIHIFTLAVFMFLADTKKNVTIHYANCSAEHMKMDQATQ